MSETLRLRSSRSRGMPSTRRCLRRRVDQIVVKSFPLRTNSVHCRARSLALSFDMSALFVSDFSLARLHRVDDLRATTIRAIRSADENFSIIWAWQKHEFSNLRHENSCLRKGDVPSSNCLAGYP